MSVIVPADHHATFAGWTATNPRSGSNGKQWSSRRRVGFLVISAVTSWILVLSPLLLLR